jgi:4-aminobutyrate aminotransferase-like enzyme
MEKQKRWMVDRDPTFFQVPFPDGYKNEDTSFDLFLATLQRHGVQPSQIAGVMSETYQGVGPDFFPVDYAKKLEAFCREHDIVLSMDEVQAAFGRTGKMFGFEHYGITPDLIACGKGITSSLPLSAVIGRSDVMELYVPGSMTSTHSASPLAVEAAIANLQVMQKEGLVAHAEKMGPILLDGLRPVQARHARRLGCLWGKGLVAGIQVVLTGTKTPDPDTATKINVACFHKGLLMFAPVGVGGECLKISPPLVITEEALRESIAVFAAACDEVLGG